MDNLEMLVGAKAIGTAMGFPPRRIYQLAEDGKLPVVKVGNSIAIRREKLLAWIEGLETEAVAGRA